VAIPLLLFIGNNYVETSHERHASLMDMATITAN